MENKDNWEIAESGLCSIVDLILVDLFTVDFHLFYPDGTDKIYRIIWQIDSKILQKKCLNTSLIHLAVFSRF